MKINLNEIIDELNLRMEDYLECDDYESEEVIKSFYDWIIEKYVE